MPEWILLGFFLYVALLARFFRDRPYLDNWPWLVLVAVAALCGTLSAFERGPARPIIAVTRDWLPLGLTFLAFREMEFFVPRDYNHAYELAWIRWDHLVLHDWQLRRLIESFGKTLPLYFEFCYLLVYGVGVYCISLLSRNRKAINRFLIVYLLGTLGAYALFPYFPTRPPRYVFPDLEPPLISTWVRHFNLFLLKTATIHAGVFPSAHVSAAFSCAWGMFLVKPARRVWGWILLVYAISVAVATVYGRYHYVVDAIAGFGLSVAAGVCLKTCDTVGDWRQRRASPSPHTLSSEI